MNYTLTNDYGVSQTPVVEDDKLYVMFSTGDIRVINNPMSFSIKLSTDDLANGGFYGYFGIRFQQITPHELYNIIKLD